jgi:hypothetical protein
MRDSRLLTTGWKATRRVGQAKMADRDRWARRPVNQAVMVSARWCLGTPNQADRADSPIAVPQPTTSSMSDPNTAYVVHSTGTAPQDSQPEAETAYEEAPPEALLPPPDFKPFFTFIEDPETGEYHHPSVHYVFSDDDQDIVTEAALRALEPSTDAEAEERVLIVDMAADGKTVESASSMSPQWQNLTTTIGQAPSWGDAGSGAERGLMVKISGKESKDDGLSHKARKGMDMGESVSRFGQELARLDAILGTLVEEQVQQPQDEGTAETVRE